MVPMSVHGLANACEISQQNAYKTVGELVQKNVLLKELSDESSHGQNLNAYGINKRYSEWLTHSHEPLSKQDWVSKQDPSQNEMGTPLKTRGEPLSKQDYIYKEVKKERKKESESSDSRVISSDLVAMMLTDFPELPVDLANDFIKHKKYKKAALTARSWKMQVNEIRKSELPAEMVLKEIMFRGWVAAKAEWLKRDNVVPFNRDEVI